MNKRSFSIIIVGLLIFLTFFIVQAGRGKPVNTIPFMKGIHPERSEQPADATTNAAQQEESYESGMFLDISTPTAGSTVTSSTIPINGKTAPSAEVFINDTEIKAGKDGSFSTKISLDEGENEIIVVVNDLEGNSAEKQLLVIYEPLP